MNNNHIEQKPVQPYTYTHLGDSPEDDIVVCNDCGASAKTEETVLHYPTCHPGESAYWEKYYEEHPEDDVIDDDPNPYAGTYSEE